MKYADILNENLSAAAKKPKVGHVGSSTRTVSQNIQPNPHKML